MPRLPQVAQAFQRTMENDTALRIKGRAPGRGQSHLVPSLPVSGFTLPLVDQLSVRVPLGLV